jgi:hypothetical protein
VQKEDEMKEFKVPYKTLKETSSGVYNVQPNRFSTIDRILMTASIIASIGLMIVARIILKAMGIL